MNARTEIVIIAGFGCRSAKRAAAGALEGVAPSVEQAVDPGLWGEVMALGKERQLCESRRREAIRGRGCELYVEAVHRGGGVIDLRLGVEQGGCIGRGRETKAVSGP